MVRGMTRPSKAQPGSPGAPSALIEAVTAVLSATLPGQSRAPGSAIDTVIGADPREVTALSPAVAVAYDAALVWCGLRSGQHSAAVELAERDAMPGLRRVARQTPASTQSACYSVLAEAYLLNGQLRESVECARFARDYADEAADDGCRFRALALLALARALSGEIHVAAAAAQEAVDFDEGGVWSAEQNSWPLVLAVAVITARTGDHQKLQASGEALQRCCGDDVVARTAARFADILIQTVRQDNMQVVALCRVLAQGVDARLTPPFFIDLALAMESVAQVQLGDPAAALAVIADRESPRDHSVCFELSRATAYLQLGDLRNVLQVTEGCLNDPEHTVGTLASVHLRRALAYEGLGMSAAAYAEYAKAVHLAYEIGALSAALGLPLEIQKVMLARLAENEPEFAAKLGGFDPEAVYPDRAPLDFEPQPLTAREQVLATWLKTDLSVPAIAAALHVSTNTVKSQLKTLYKKLSVSSRDEAVLRLERLGAYARVGERRPGAGSRTPPR